jgi:MraZ protein
MFFGEYDYQLDQKNRLRLPVKLKEELGNTPVMTCGSDGCLYILPKTEAENILNKIIAEAEKDPEAKKALRFYTKYAFQIEEDTQGRYIIPSRLKDYAKINKNVIYIGRGNIVELWSQENWNSYENNSDLKPEDMFNILSKYGV